jgi:flavin reductase (DIM6/NTAB) family NADH-FMN oxidoreductase RutF
MPLDEAYRLINTGPVVLVSSRSKDDKYDVAPIAWACPAGKSPSRVLLGVGKSHKTYTNIKETGVFVAGVPHISQTELVKQTGSSKGEKVDKFAHFSIDSFPATEVDCLVPFGQIGFLECRVVDIFESGQLSIIVGEVIAAAVKREAYDGQRILSERPIAKPILHLGEGNFLTLSDEVID